MKWLILALSICITVTGFSQIKHDKKSFKYGEEFLNRNQPYLSLLKKSNPFFIPRAQKAYSTKLGTVYILPQDGMPCIVPDLKTHQSMPNPGINYSTKKPIPFRQIPNPYLVYPFITE